MSSNAASRKPEPQAAQDSIVEVRDVHYSIGGRDLLGPEPADPARPHHGHHGAERHRQDDAAAPDHRAGQARQRPGAVRRHRCQQPEHQRAVRAAPAHGHAVPERRAAHRRGRVRERRVPVARAHRPARVADPQYRAHQAAGRGSARRRAADAFGVVRRHGATRSARARDGDGSGSADLRRAVHRPRSDLHGHDRAAGAADEPRSASRASSCRTTSRSCRSSRTRHHRRRQGGCVGQLRRAEGSRFEIVHQFINGLADGPVAFHYPAPDYYEELLAG